MKAIYPGTFDPFTIGHLEVVKKSLKLFDSVVIGVALDTGRQNQAPIEKRIEIVKRSVEGLKNVNVVAFEGLLTDFLKNQGTSYLVRGLRNEKDFLAEQPLSQIYHSQNQNIKPVYFITSPQFSHISSSMVRELLRLNGDISEFVANEAKPLILATYFSF
ncbi:MAG: pantetheine-phosphate adenylyltransferase [Firmicutes bacterium]|nr:pantetheine-phosphate adenylyltransferase [Bacillota bacterium]